MAQNRSPQPTTKDRPLADAGADARRRGAEGVAELWADALEALMDLQPVGAGAARDSGAVGS